MSGKAEPVGTARATELVQAIEAKKMAFAAVATQHLTTERLIKLAQLVTTTTPDLAKCTTASIVIALMTCAKLGLEPNEPGGVWLVPHNIKRRGKDGDEFVKIAVPIVDYRGLVDVVRRSKQIAMLRADVVCEHDKFEYYTDTTGDQAVVLKHTPNIFGDRGQVVGVYAWAKMTNGEVQASVLSISEIEYYRGKSQGGDSKFSPWSNDWAAMAMKTAIRRVVNLLPKSPDVQAAQSAMATEARREVLLASGDPVALEEFESDAVSTEMVRMPTRKSERPPVSPSAAPAEDDARVVILDVAKRADGSACTVKVSDGKTYTATEAEVVAALRDAASAKRHVELVVERGVIVAIE